jgi:hypothetical protein
MIIKIFPTFLTKKESVPESTIRVDHQLFDNFCFYFYYYDRRMSKPCFLMFSGLHQNLRMRLIRLP